NGTRHPLLSGVQTCAPPISDIVLMDIVMPRMDGLEATRRIKAAQPETKVIILTVYDEEPYREAARESGADAFLLKETVLAELIQSGRAAGREGYGWVDAAER